MGTGHDHGPGRTLTATGRHRGRLATVLVITIGIAVAEVCGALVSGSLVLLADAAHMAADAAGVGLSLLAAYVAARPASDRWTFGYARAEILAATVNALLLLGMAVFILIEAARRLASPPAVEPGLMIAFGAVALAGNGVSLLLLRHGQAESLNVRGAFLEVASDTFGAIAVIGTGLVVAVTGFSRADSIASIAVALLILPRAWRLLRDAVDVLLEASPRDRPHRGPHPPDRAGRRDGRARPARLDDHLRAPGALRARGGGPRRAGQRPERGHARRTPGVPARSLRRRALHVPVGAGQPRRA
jgi:cobalt-zinc-cadmium efflux system protein